MTTSPPRQWFTDDPARDSDPFLHRHDSAADMPAQDTQAQATPGSGLTDKRSADIRRRAIDRLVAMNINQAEVSWRVRRRDPLEPHGVALLYIQSDPKGLPPYRYRLTAATRLWLQDDHRFNVHHRVFRFYRDLAAELNAPGTDVRAHTDRRDDAMMEDAVYIGLGVSSLDTSTGCWRDVVTTASVATTDTRPARLWGRMDGAAARPATSPVHMQVEDYRDIPGSFRIMLTDGTVIVGERRGRPDFDHKIIHSTHTLDFGPYDNPYPWGWVTREQLDADPDHAEVLRWMGQLNELCWQTDTARLAASTSPAQPRRAHR